MNAGQHTWYVEIAGQRLYEKINSTPMDFEDVTVWLSNPWYVAAPVEIRNFTLDGNPLPDSHSTTQQPIEVMGRPKLSEFSGEYYKHLYESHILTHIILGDSFNMKPLSVGCQSSWKIDCVVASCSLDLQKKNPEVYERYCKVNYKHRQYFCFGPEYVFVTL